MWNIARRCLTEDEEGSKIGDYNITNTKGGDSEGGPSFWTIRTFHQIGHPLIILQKLFRDLKE
jgi:hypothetical protein